MNTQFQQFQKLILNKFKYKLFLLFKLPMAFFSGLNVIEFTAQKSVVTVKFKWLNQNPFQSIYFAVLAMAAELSTGILAFGQIYKRNPSISMLVVKLEAEFYKKTTGKIYFTCTDGDKITEAIEQSILQNIATTIQCTSIGKNSKDEVVTKFTFTWSFKTKTKLL